MLAARGIEPTVEAMAWAAIEADTHLAFQAYLHALANLKK